VDLVLRTDVSGWILVPGVVILDMGYYPGRSGFFCAGTLPENHVFVTTEYNDSMQLLNQNIISKFKTTLALILLKSTPNDLLTDQATAWEIHGKPRHVGSGWTLSFFRVNLVGDPRKDGEVFL
jgi:hypothetical protein